MVWYGYRKRKIEIQKYIYFSKILKIFFKVQIAPSKTNSRMSIFAVLRKTLLNVQINEYCNYFKKSYVLIKENFHYNDRNGDKNTLGC